MNFLESFNKNPIIGVLRGIEKKDCTSVIEAAMNGGITCVEITMNTTAASSLVNLATVFFNNKCCIGAGTVLTLEQCKEAIDSGAQYIVTPNTQREIIEFCKNEEIPVVAGAMTPTEIYDAWKYGATMVKVFPVDCIGGPEYIRELRGPFATIPLVTFGAIPLDKVDDYFIAGVNGIGIGKRLFNPEWIRDRNYQKIKDCAESFTKAVEKYRKK
jgi:2-dehydro-3-deoxyphosphogluconate aldolase / (4S)-4-hydroxy-2-oxoglutarate aldolase